MPQKCLDKLNNAIATSTRTKSKNAVCNAMQKEKKRNPKKLSRNNLWNPNDVHTPMYMHTSVHLTLWHTLGRDGFCLWLSSQGLLLEDPDSCFCGDLSCPFCSSCARDSTLSPV